MKKEQDTIAEVEKLKADGLPVLIFGSGVVGEMLFHVCEQNGLRPAAFCDNNVHKTGSLLCGIPVLHVPKLKEKYEDAVFLISAADISDVVSQLKELGFARWLPANLFLRNFDPYSKTYSVPGDFAAYAVTTCLLCHESYTSDRLFLRSVDLIITEKCSLKCRDCSNLMQYYKSPKDCRPQDVFRSVAALCSLVDEINEFRVIGGEPFMNREFHLIIRSLAVEQKVRKIVIYTNGTILPSDSQLDDLRNGKVVVIITDYGHLSRNIDKLKEKLSVAGVTFHSPKAGGWTDCSDISKKGRTGHQNQEIFKRCCSKNTFTLSGDRFFRCPFSANAYRLSAIPDSQKDYILLKSAGGKSSEPDARRELREFVLKNDAIDACDYCNGRPYGAPEIEPAVQLKSPKPYIRACGPEDR